mmetsp:Transcript_2148/g.7063  ORF Transcript_2148/g.7063 Transcript_2148/m.7063 type:complete len:208 (+) Transcript_2148:81-704(+)
MSSRMSWLVMSRSHHGDGHSNSRLAHRRRPQRGVAPPRSHNHAAQQRAGAQHRRRDERVQQRGPHAAAAGGLGARRVRTLRPTCKPLVAARSRRLRAAAALLRLRVVAVAGRDVLRLLDVVRQRAAVRAAVQAARQRARLGHCAGAAGAARRRARRRERVAAAAVSAAARVVRFAALALGRVNVVGVKAVDAAAGQVAAACCRRVLD